jgi:hypothetical protein
MPALAAFAVQLPAQQARPQPAMPSQGEGQQQGKAAQADLAPLPPVLRYPENQDAVLATLDGRDIRLIELGRYLEQRYDPGILARWALPEGRRELNSPVLGELLWQFLDVLALHQEAELAKLPMSELQAAVDKELKAHFENVYKKKYEEQRGRPIDEKAMDFYVARHRRQMGLRTEVQCLLNGLVPRLFKVSELRAFHMKHGHYFGGKLLTAHIHFATRDRSTGRRFSPSKLAEVRNRMREVQRQLAAQPDQFEKLAAQFSDDRVTGPKGGELGWVTRFDERLPAVLVRTAWELDQGEVSSPIESFYGYHLVKRLRFVQHHFLLPRKESFHKIAGAIQKVQQEDFLFESRKRHPRVVRY